MYSVYTFNIQEIQATSAAKSMSYARFLVVSRIPRTKKKIYIEPAYERTDEIPPLIFINNDNEERDPQQKMCPHNIKRSEKKIKFTSSRIKLYVFVCVCLCVCFGGLGRKPQQRQRQITANSISKISLPLPRSPFRFFSLYLFPLKCYTNMCVW